jgi:PKD repeat protein
VLTYQWTLSAPAGSTAVLATPTAVAASFTADLAGAYTATLIVTDDEGIASPADSVTITAGAAQNRAPTANAGEDQTAELGEVIQLDGGASSDLDGDALTYRWTLTGPEGSTAQLSDAAIVNPTFTVDRAGQYIAALIVTDTAGLQSEPDTAIVSTAGNLPPVADAGENRSAQPGELVELDGSGSSDPNDDELSYEWALSVPEGSAAVLSDETSVNPTFTVDRAGEYAAALIVRDAQGLESETDTVVISTANVAPVANAGADRSAAPGDEVQLDGGASRDANGDPLSYRWSLLSAPAGSEAELTSEEGEQVGLRVDLPGTYVAQLLVNDGLQDSEPDTVSITVGATDTACQIRYRGVVRNDEGKRLTFSGLAQSEDGDVRGRQYFVDVTRGQRPLQLRALGTETLECTEKHATLTGDARVSGEREPVQYTIELWRKGNRDLRYRLQLSNGYDTGKQKLYSGSIEIEVESDPRD